MKHIPTGLYFQPHKHRGSHLSKRGKIYQTNINGIESGNKGYKCFTVCCEKGSQIHKLTVDKLSWNDGWSYNQLKANTNFSDWEREYIV
jgi:hypothetical protein